MALFDPAHLDQLEQGYQLSQAPQQVASNVASPQQGGFGDIPVLGGLVNALTAAPAYFIKTDIINPFREISAQLSGDKQLYRQAVKQSNIDLGLGATGSDIGGGLEKLAGNTLDLGTMLLAPEAKAGLLPNLAQGAKIGALAGAGNAMADQGSANDVVGGTLLGALTGGVLGGTVGGVGKVVSGVNSAAANRAASTATRQAEADAIAREQPFRGIGKVATQNDLQGTIQHLSQLGIEPTPANMAAAADLVTGQNGIVSGTTRQILSSLGTVNTNGVLNDAKTAITKETVHLGNVEDRGSAANNALRTIRNTIETIGNKGQGSLSGKMDANAALDTIQQFEARIRELGGTNASGANGAEARILKATADSLKSKLAGGGADTLVASYTLSPQDVAQIVKDVQAAGGSKQLAQHIVDGINSAASLQDLRSLQKPFVNASKLSKAADTAAGGRFTASPPGGASPVDTAANIMTNLALGNHFGIAQNAGRFASKSGIVDNIIGGAGKLSGALSSVGNKVSPAVLPQAERALGASAAGAAIPAVTPASAASPASYPPAAFSATGMTAPTATDAITNALAAAQYSSTSPFDPANLQSSIAQLVAGGGTMNDVTQFLDIATAINKLTSANAQPTPGYSRPSAAQYSQATTAEQAIGQLAQMLQSDPSLIGKGAVPGQGIPLLGGLESSLLGTNQYQALTNNILNSVARINTGANMPASEEAFYRKTYLPQPGDPPATVQQKIANLMSFFQPILNYPGASNNGSASDLISALGGASQ